ncbi:Hypothetical protein R9X50_00394300 [Acrodontium crateriforme]|uniref:Phytanoyl-CoA dioxygenase n=1 Tax=Acrodontium crateriforme TaxID=150365 RepID=A0AAQ3RCA5_9PEZI|nr:Hypothetical protein R9X50_00394300 [Acrodontium crateriforme]
MVPCNNMHVSPRCYSLNSPPSLDDFKRLLRQTTDKSTYPLAAEIQNNVPIYNCASCRLDDSQTEALQNEWHHILLRGPGVFVLKRFFTQKQIIDVTNEAFNAIMAHERETNGNAGDHFAATSTNARIWNSFSKHCLQDPMSFVTYYSNPLFRTVCEAWLGPGFRLTAQVNIVKPGGEAQVSHRDYHIGFQTERDAAQWPKAIQIASQFLTLQGAVAHTDMPLDSGPTRLLPFSQMFEEGYMAYRREEFAQYFLDHYVALPLEKGDAIFFNPALFHAAGENTTESFERKANLIQASSAFGKTMETIATIPLVERTWNILVERYAKHGMNDEVDAFVRAVADGYPFPTNLDRRPPAPGGMAPESEQDLLRRGLNGKWSRERIVSELIDLQEKSKA